MQEGRAFRFGHELHMAHGDRLLDLADRMGTSVEQLVATNYNRLTHIHNPDRPGKDVVICVVPSFRQSKVPFPPFPLRIFAFLRLHCTSPPSLCWPVPCLRSARSPDARVLQRLQANRSGSEAATGGAQILSVRVLVDWRAGADGARASCRRTEWEKIFAKKTPTSDRIAMRLHL